MKTPVALCFLLVAALNVRAQNSGTGIGVIIGDPTGVSVKHWLSDRRALDLAAAWSLDNNESLHVHADYLWHDFNSLDAVDQKSKVGWYYGVGARFVVRDGDGHDDNDNDDTFGARVPFGFDYFFAGTPLEGFLELAPSLTLIPATDVDFDIGIGVRIYFH